MRCSTLVLLSCVALAFTHARGSEEQKDDMTFVKDGGKSLDGRTLLQSAGTAAGSYSGQGATQSDSKRYPTGNTCYIASSTSANIDCKLQGTGTYFQQVPACCSSTSRTSDNSCSTFDNAGSIECSNVRKYPACCEYRDQPASVCNVAGANQNSVSCSGNRPAIECCGSTTCSFDNAVLGTNYGQYVTRTCTSGQRLACCPA